jgi:hypothetical protein
MLCSDLANSIEICIIHGSDDLTLRVGRRVGASAPPASMYGSTIPISSTCKWSNPEEIKINPVEARRRSITTKRIEQQQPKEGEPAIRGLTYLFQSKEPIEAALDMLDGLLARCTFYWRNPWRLPRIMAHIDR